MEIESPNPDEILAKVKAKNHTAANLRFSLAQLQVSARPMRCLNPPGCRKKKALMLWSAG